MYSGGDSSGDGVNSRNQFNWQMTSQTSCNINSGGSIDWASLAQQWIQMKDSGAGLPDTPPPPVISANSKVIRSTKFDEQGEADMEVEKDDELQVIGFGQNTPPPPTNNFNSDRWFPTQPDTGSYCAPQQNQWTSWPARVALPPPTLHVPISTGSLTPPIPKDAASTTPPLQSIPKTPSEAASLLPSKESLEPPPMDAAKRKILPAWIREGLEKMEREKLKQLEREQKDKDPSAAGTASSDSDINNKFNTMVKSSTTEMEGESSGNEANETTEAASPYNDNAASDAMVATINSNVPKSVQQECINSNSGKTYEERISDMMIAVRKTLTELLLEVTNEEISSIAYEAIRKRRAKASSAQVIRKSAIPSITGKLGLEAYADSDSENSASDDEGTNDSKRSDDENDSEEDLKANIRICKRAFAKTVEEIEERIQTSAVREELLLKEHQKRNTRDHHGTDYNRSPLRSTKGFDTEIGEPQPDKKSNSNGKRRKERTSRFSDNKDSRHRMATNYYQPPSMGSGNLPSQVMPGASATMPPTNFAAAAKYKSNSNAGSSSLTASQINEKRSTNISSSANKTPKAQPASSSSKHHRQSDSPSYSSDSSSSDTRSSHSRRSKYTATHHMRSSIERSKRSHRSSSYRSNRRRDSSDSNEDDNYKKRSSRRRPHKSGSSSVYSRRHDRRRSDSRSSRSRTRSRSRSTTYSSSRRGDRY